MSQNTSPKNYFKTRGYIPGGIVTSARAQDLAIDRLPPFLRVLLATDGTVTKSLEAYFWEPVSVDNLGQQPGPLGRDLPSLEAQAGETVLERRVRLKGAESGDVYAYAESTLRLALLPDKARDDILTGRIGIGELLRESGLETYREILDVGRETRDDLRGVFENDACRDLVYRTYRIVLNHRPAILITEHFPYALYALRGE